MEKTGTKKTKEKQQTKRSPEESRIFQEHKKGIAEFITDKEYKPLKFREMAALLQVPKEEKEELRQVLKELMEEGVIIQDAQSRYKGVSADTLIGIFSGGYFYTGSCCKRSLARRSGTGRMLGTDGIATSDRKSAP